MSTGKLKAQYNRVRTSTALHTTSIWSNTIGLQQEQTGTNSAIEASIYAPGGGGRGREAKRQRAQELIDASGYQPSVRDFEGLKALARRSGGDAALNRGACKLCGGLGHLTKQCRNFLDKNSADAAAGGADGAAAGGGDGDRQLLTEADEARLLESDSMDSSDQGLGSDSDSDRDRKRRRKERPSREKERSSSKKNKKEKSKKHKKEKSKKHKRDRRSRSRSRSRDRSDRQRERSRSRSLDRRA